MIKSNSGIRKADVINRRMFIIGAAKIVVFAGIIARLFSFICKENTRATIPAKTTNLAAPIMNILLLITSVFLMPEFDLIICLF